MLRMLHVYTKTIVSSAQSPKGIHMLTTVQPVKAERERFINAPSKYAILQCLCARSLHGCKYTHMKSSRFCVTESHLCATSPLVPNSASIKCLGSRILRHGRREVDRARDHDEKPESSVPADIEEMQCPLRWTGYWHWIKFTWMADS